jgi:hypothetical protein
MTILGSPWHRHMPLTGRIIGMRCQQLTFSGRGAALASSSLAFSSPAPSLGSVTPSWPTISAAGGCAAAAISSNAA